jgi:dTDP-4-dehydrorhamnose 3,5-epimerase
MGNFKFHQSPLPGLLIIEPRVFPNEFAEHGLTAPFVQNNHSRSQQGVVRGMHYQINPAPMGKMVKCTRGSIFDVGVDLRRGSPTFGQWYGELLTGENHKMLYLPPGFAHGFLALAEDNEVIYACTGVYTPALERSLLWNDPAVGIKWPLDRVGQVIVSDKDAKNPRLKEAETNFVYQA